MMENDASFERVLDPSPGKRKRSSILKPPDKRGRRDSKTVSFNDCCVYKELHQDGTCDMTNLFLRDDMDLTMMDIVEPFAVVQNEDQIEVEREYDRDDHEKSVDLSVSMVDVTPSIIDSQPHSQSSRQPSTTPDNKLSQQSSQRRELTQHTITHHTPQTYNNTTQMDLTLVSKFMQECSHIETPIADYDATKLYDKRMSLASDMSGISSLGSSSSTLGNVTMSSCKTLSNKSINSHDKTLVGQPKDNTTMLNVSSLGNFSEISSFHDTLIDQSMNQTFYGAFHDSNDISRRTSLGNDTLLMNNIGALDECIYTFEQELEESRKKLDDEIEDLFKFYRHIVNADNKYEFAIAIFGLRYSLWLIFDIDPETYPHEYISIRFAVNKKDRHLYPFAEFSEAVRRTTKEGREGYLTRFVFNCQKFRRFLRKRLQKTQMNQPTFD